MFLKLKLKVRDATQGRQNYLNLFGPRKDGVCIHTFYEKYDVCFASGYKAHASLMIHTRQDRPIPVLLLGILKKGPDPARTFKKRANQNISGPHTHLMQNTLSISICALPFYKKLL